MIWHAHIKRFQTIWREGRITRAEMAKLFQVTEAELLFIARSLGLYSKPPMLDGSQYAKAKEFWLRDKLNTADIALHVRAPEAAVANSLSRWREYKARQRVA